MCALGNSFRRYSQFKCALQLDHPISIFSFFFLMGTEPFFDLFRGADAFFSISSSIASLSSLCPKIQVMYIAYLSAIYDIPLVIRHLFARFSANRKYQQLFNLRQILKKCNNPALQESDYNL